MAQLEAVFPKSRLLRGTLGWIVAKDDAAVVGAFPQMPGTYARSYRLVVQEADAHFGFVKTEVSAFP